MITIPLLRAHVNHYSFVTSFLGKQAGKSGGPDDCSVGLNVILSVDVFEGVKVEDPMWPPTLTEAPYHNVLRGHIFQCTDLLSFIGGTYDSKKLAEHKFPLGLLLQLSLRLKFGKLLPTHASPGAIPNANLKNM